MAENLKTLGQALPAANTLTDLYTVPANTNASCSSLNVSNQTANAIAFRVSVAVAGAVDARKQYLYYDAVLPANLTVVLVNGISLGPGDVVRVQTDTLNVSFNLFGVEVT